MKKSIVVLFIVAIIVLLSIVQAILANSLSTSGVLVSEIDREIKVYKTQNAVLREKIFSEKSLNNIASKAATLGFAGEKYQLVLGASLPLAVRQ